jgi:hypothetical protein
MTDRSSRSRSARAWTGVTGATSRDSTATGSGSALRPSRVACAELGITVKKTPPFQPQTNGKVERCLRAPVDGRAFTRSNPGAPWAAISVLAVGRVSRCRLHGGDHCGGDVA